MKLKKLWAMLLIFAMLAPTQNAIAATDDESREADVAYWIQVTRDGDIQPIYNTRTTDELSENNTSDISGRREPGKPVENINYVVVTDYDQITNSYYDFNDYDEITGGVYVTPTYYDIITPDGYETDPTASPTPYQNPTDSPEPTEKPTPFQNPTNSPEPTEKPTPFQNPTNSPEPTEKPTPFQNPVPVVVRPDPSGNIYVTPEVKTPQKVSFNVDLEVGRLAHIKPQQAMNHSKTSSNTAVLNEPRLATGSFNAEYEARANKPGNATLTFYNQTEQFTEEWNVNVYCRPLDFEKTEYVVEKKAGKNGYITLFLKYFEYEFEYAYAFEWSSSDKSVAYLAGGDQLSTFARFCVVKPGVTIITVKDKYGNSSQCALIVKDAEIAQATPEPTPAPTTTPVPTAVPTPKPTNAPEPTKDPVVTVTPEPTATATPKPTKTPKPTATPTPEEEAGGLTREQLNKMVKASKLDLKATKKSGKIVLKWQPDEMLEMVLSGYQIQVKGPKDDKFKTIKTIKHGTTLTFDFTEGKNKKTYQFRIRAYTKDHNTGKKIYSKWSDIAKAKFKKAAK